MKTSVFKKAGYFAAAFALAASGSIFVPTATYADGDTSNVITQATVDAGGGSLIPINEAVCRGEVNSFVLGGNINAGDGVGTNRIEDWLDLCVDGDYVEGVDEDEFAVDGVFTIDLNGYTISSNSDNYATVVFDEGIDFTVVGNGHIVNNGAGPIFSGDGTLTIKGGTYNKEIDTVYVYNWSTDYTEYKVSDDEYTVDTYADLADFYNFVDSLDPEFEIVLRAGDELDLTKYGLSESVLKYAQYDMSINVGSDEGMSPVDYLEWQNGRIVGKQGGVILLSVELNKVEDEENVSDISVFIYEENNDDASLHVKINGTDAQTRDELADVVGSDTVTAIEEEIGDEIAGYYNIEAALVNEGNSGTWTIRENLGELNEAKTVTLTIPSGLPVVADGYVRNYYVVYYHNGEVKKITDVTDNGDGTVSFESKEFSPYILAYYDTAVVVDDNTETETVTSEGVVLASASVATANPNTLDNGMSYIVLASAAAVTMTGAAIYLTRREA